MRKKVNSRTLSGNDENKFKLLPFDIFKNNVQPFSTLFPALDFFYYIYVNAVINNYLPNAKCILFNSLLDEIEWIIQQHLVSLR